MQWQKNRYDLRLFILDCHSVKPITYMCIKLTKKKSVLFNIECQWKSLSPSYTIYDKKAENKIGDILMMEHLTCS